METEIISTETHSRAVLVVLEFFAIRIFCFKMNPATYQRRFWLAFIQKTIFWHFPIQQEQGKWATHTMHNYKYLINEWQEFNITRESNKPKTRLDLKNIKPLGMLEISVLDPCFISTCAQSVLEPAVSAPVSIN